MYIWFAYWWLGGHAGPSRRAPHPAQLPPTPPLAPPAGAGGDQLLLSTRAEQLDYLSAVLAASDADLAEEDEADARDDVANVKKK